MIGVSAVVLSGRRTDNEDSHRVQLLRDIRATLEEREVEQIGSSDLVFALNGLEAARGVAGPAARALRLMH